MFMKRRKVRWILKKIKDKVTVSEKIEDKTIKEVEKAIKEKPVKTEKKIEKKELKAKKKVVAKKK